MFHPPPISHRRGVALLLTLLVITIMILTIGQISYSTKVEVKIAQNFRDDLQNQKAISSGIHFTKAFLQIDSKKKGNEEYHCLKDSWATTATQSLGGSSLAIDIRDEERKFNLLRLISNEDKERETAKTQFKRLVGLIFNDNSFDTDAMTEDLLMWMTNETEIRKEQKIELPLYTLDEIRLIPEFMEKYFPEDEDRTYTLSSLLDQLTLFSSKQVNINTATAEVLQCLHEDVPDEFVTLIAGHRESEEEGFKSLTEVEELLKINESDERAKIFNEIRPFLSVKSSYFSSTLTASQGNLSRKYIAYFQHSREKTTLIHWELLD